MSTAKKARATSTACDNIIDSAFVPNMEDSHKSEDKTDLGLMNNLLSALAQDKSVIDTGYKADPDDGEHVVTIKEYWEGKGQYGNSDYLAFAIREQSTGRKWTMFLSVASVQDVINFIETISENNGGLFENKNRLAAFQELTLGKKAFSVWTVKAGNKVRTYVDKTRYEKFLYAQGNREANAQLRQQKRADNEALANAEKKASDNVRAGKAP